MPIEPPADPRLGPRWGLAEKTAGQEIQSPLGFFRLFSVQVSPPLPGWGIRVSGSPGNGPWENSPPQSVRRAPSCPVVWAAGTPRPSELTTCPRVLCVSEIGPYPRACVYLSISSSYIRRPDMQSSCHWGPSSRLLVWFFLWTARRE